MAALDERTTGVLLCGRFCERALRGGAYFDRPEGFGCKSREDSRPRGKSMSPRRRSRRAQNTGKARRYGGYERELRVDAIARKVHSHAGTGASRLGRLAAESKDRRGNSAWEDPARPPVRKMLCPPHTCLFYFVFVIWFCRVNIVVTPRSPGSGSAEASATTACEENDIAPRQTACSVQNARPVFEFRF